MAGKKLTIIGVLAGIAALAAILLPGYTKLQDLSAENERLEKRITELTRSIEELETEKDRLENDILYIEKVARENLGVVREREMVIEQEP
jgi:cell division protein FtsB